jgi:hypothetical protein
MSIDPNAPIPAAQPSAATLTFRPFTQEDWFGFAGAERFTNGDEPLIAEGFFAADQREWFLVLDGSGGTLLVQDNPHNEHGGYRLDCPFESADVARAWATDEFSGPSTLAHFLNAGFTT